LPREFAVAVRSELARLASAAPEVELRTFGRSTGRPPRRIVWITTDALGRVHVRSGAGPSRDWPLNLVANPRAVLHVHGRDLAVLARRVHGWRDRHRSPAPVADGRRAAVFHPLVDENRVVDEQVDDGIEITRRLHSKVTRNHTRNWIGHSAKKCNR
jgi:F420H(2)-dependent quinone reductase